MIKPALAPPMGEPPSSVSICKSVASGISIDCMGTPLYLCWGPEAATAAGTNTHFQEPPRSAEMGTLAA
jgi:hypothetical protein